MDHDKLFSIIDYGSSKFRLGAFNYKNDGSKYVTNNINFNNDENFKNLILMLYVFHFICDQSAGRHSLFSWLTTSPSVFR